MEKWKSLIQQNRLLQAILLAALVLTSALSVYLTDKSVTGFLVLLGSLLLLYYTSFPNWAKWAIAAVLLVVIIPFATSHGPSYEAYMEVASFTGIYIAMALGLNIVVGFAGLLDLGFIAFFAIGAYTYAIFASKQAQNFITHGHFPLSGEWFWLFILIGGAIAALFGILLGIPVLRVKGDYLAIVTLGFGEIIRIIANNLDQPVNITNGSQGVSGVQPAELFGYQFPFAHQIYFIVLAVLAFVIFGVRRVEDSRLGRSWKAVREDEIAAQAMGVPLVRTKLWAFALGASFSGFMGVVFAAKQGFIDPTSFTLLESITILVMVILGGMGSVPGVILGAAVITLLNLQVLNEITSFLNDTFPDLPPALSPSGMQKFIFGAVLVCIALFRPQGLIPAKNKQVDPAKLEAALAQTATSAESTPVENTPAN